LSSAIESEIGVEVIEALGPAVLGKDTPIQYAYTPAIKPPASIITKSMTFLDRELKTFRGFRIEVLTEEYN
jgi:hypothetical protein